MRPLYTTALILASFAALPAYGQTQAKRRDLGADFSAAVCDGTLGGLPTKAWTLSVFDSQVEGRRISAMGGLKLNADKLERKAKTLARLRGAGGYASGLCKDGTGWAVAMPASAALVSDKNHRVKLPLTELAANCESYRADFAAAGEGQPKSLAIVAGGLPADKLGDGVIGVTCQPKAPRWRGPTLWFLYPTGNGPAASVPEGEIFAESPAMPVADLLAAWVNRVRIKEGLKALEFKAELTEQAGLLAVDGSLSHDRNLLKKTAALLVDTAQMKLLGEDRVRGKDAASMAWLWWNSPRHRALLLNPDATSGGLASRGLGEEQLAVLAVATGAPLQTAKAAKRKGKTANR